MDDKKKADDKKPEVKKDEEPITVQAGSEWAGVCTYPDDDEHYPFELEVLKVEGEKIEVCHAS